MLTTVRRSHPYVYSGISYSLTVSPLISSLESLLYYAMRNINLFHDCMLNSDLQR